MTLLPKSRRGRIAASVALVAIGVYCAYQFWPREAVFQDHPSSWWAERMLELEGSQKEARHTLSPHGGGRLYLNPEAGPEACITSAELNNKGIVPVLADLLRHPDPDVRFRATVCLWQRSPDNPEEEKRMVPILIEALGQIEEPAKRWTAAGVLQQIKAQTAAPAAPALLEAMKDPHPEVRGEAYKALYHIDPKLAMDARAGKNTPARGSAANNVN